MDVFIIKNWEAHFEVAQASRVNRWSWVPLPVKHDGRGYRRLLAQDDGTALYGAWVLTIQVAAKCPVRGFLADIDGPLTAEDLALKTSGREAVFERMLELTTSERIGWIIRADYEQALSALNLQDRQNLTRPNQTKPNQPKKKDALPNGSCAPPELRLWLDWWNGLKREQLVAAGVDSESPSEAVLNGWRRVETDPALRSLLLDRDALEREIRASEFCREGWFRLEKLFGAKNRDRELIVRKLIEGAYRSSAPPAKAGKNFSIAGHLDP